MVPQNVDVVAFIFLFQYHNSHTHTTLMQVRAFALMARRCGMASLLSCASYLGRFPKHSIVVLKLFFLTVLESGAPLSSSELEEVLYKFLNE